MRVARIRGRRVMVAAGGVAAVVVLSGCGSTDDDQASPPSAGPSTTSPAPSPSATASPTPSETSSIPAAAQKQTPEGAEAFAKFYIEQSGKAWTEPAPSLLEGLATPNCQTCKNLQSNANDLLATNRRYSSMPIRWESAERLSGTEQKSVFEVELTELATSLVDASGAVVESYEKRAISRAVAVVWQEGQWQVDGISE